MFSPGNCEFPRVHAKREKVRAEARLTIAVIPSEVEESRCGKIEGNLLSPTRTGGRALDDGFVSADEALHLNMSTRLSDYDYHLPRQLIAQHPPARRQDARMMVLDRERNEIEHARFADLKEFLREDDLLVLNNSRVLRARHFSDDGKFEFLFLEKIAPRHWKALVRPSRKFGKGGAAFIRGTCAEAGAMFPDGSHEVVLSQDVDLQRGGAMPLPPYIKRPAIQGSYSEEDNARYQTVYAKHDGSLAAPTAGLHFTPDILRILPHVFITLHLGTGTFRPVKTGDITKHKMHPERFSI